MDITGRHAVHKLIRRLVIAALLVAAAALGFVLLGSEKTQTRYRTDTVARGSITDVVTASGTLNPIELVNVGTQVSGQVNSIRVKVNSQVKKGQLLAEIDPQLLASQVKQDRSNLETSRINFEQAGRDLQRNKQLLAKDYIAKVDLEHAQQSYMQAKNSYDAAKTQVERDVVNLDYTKIYSPIDGIVISQEVKLGETVAASFQTPNMFKIAGDLTKMKIDVNLSESDITKVKEGMPAVFTVDAFADHEFSGAVQTVNLNPNTQQGVVTYTVVVTLDNPEKLLLPGMTAYVSVKLFEKKDVLRIPATALHFTLPQERISGMSRLLGASAKAQTDLLA